jgi:putative DNA methylase
MGERLLAIVAEGKKGRIYLPPLAEHEHLASAAVGDLAVDGIKAPLADDPRNLWCLKYGLDRFDKLFTSRQLSTLAVFSDIIKECRTIVRAAADEAGIAAAEAYADAVTTYLAFALNKAATRNCTQTTWYRDRDSTMAGFSRQAIAMTWDYAEVNPLLESTGSLAATAEWVAECLDTCVPPSSIPGTVAQSDAAKAPLADGVVCCTDPPYYDNIGYADLSDFFYLWLRRTLAELYPSLFSTLVTPKAAELIAAPHRHEGDRQAANGFFESGLRDAFTCMRKAAPNDYPITVFYAFKQAEIADDDGGDVDGGHETQSGIASTGWETMLEGLIAAGLSITGTWPMRTEQPHGLRVIEANSLASSIVLVCRARPSDSPMTSRREFVSVLKRELPSALRELQLANIAPVDLAQAAIGPGMAVYSRYSKVLESSGERLTVRTALALINQVLDEVLAEQEGDYDADTRWSLKWFEQFAHDDGPFGDANTLATAMSIGINGLVDTGIVQAKAGKVRLLKRTELMGGNPDTWDPATDEDIVHWEVCQYLIHALDTKGEAGAAALLQRINARYPGAAETARELAYRLYTICERKKWAQEAMAYNSLIVAWPEIVKLAQSSGSSGVEAQTTMF